ncbi:MAG: KEOPS complex kinase/ATPase Bud32 [Nanoarchaeota archaeon]
MILAQGAEAILTREGMIVIKHRIQKKYRLEVLDSVLRRSRQRREAKVIMRLEEAGVPVPHVLESDEKDMKLGMDFINGPKVRDVMDAEPKKYGAAVGALLAKMHEVGIAHGDPTTSNFIAGDNVHVIDFGLSFFTKKIEDYAVDLHLLRQVLSGTHTTVFETAWAAALDSYVTTWPDGAKVIAWLDAKVEKRGRNKKR